MWLGAPQCATHDTGRQTSSPQSFQLPLTADTCQAILSSAAARLARGRPEARSHRGQTLALANARGVHEHAPRPAVDVVLLDGSAHEAHAVAALVAAHAHRDLHGLGGLVDVERVYQ